MRYQERREALAEQLRTLECDVAVIDRPEHVQWLTGFTGSNGAVLVNADGEALISTDGRYTTQVANEVPDLRCVIARQCVQALLGEVEVETVGFEAEHTSYAAYTSLDNGDIAPVPMVKVIENLREEKDAEELDALRRAAQVAVDAFQSLIDDGCVSAGRTERQIAADLEYRMRIGGAERPSFDTIVASGPNSARPHHGVGDRVLEDGDLVTIDFGALVDGYCSDMTRTLGIGDVGEERRKIYSVVLQAQLAGLEAARPGIDLAVVDAACRDIIVAAGYGEYFVHSTGHGIGIDVHEAPFASTRSEGSLRAGMTLTIEPGIYVPGVGGVRIEDTVIITDAEPENLVPLTKTL